MNCLPLAKDHIKPQTIRRVFPCSTNSHLVRLCFDSVSLCVLMHFSSCAVSQKNFTNAFGRNLCRVATAFCAFRFIRRSRATQTGEAFAVWYDAVPSHVHLVSYARVTYGAARTEQVEIIRNSPNPAGRRNRPIQSSLFVVHEREFVNQKEFKFSIFTPVSQGSGFFRSSLVGPRVLFPLSFTFFRLLSHGTMKDKKCLFTD